MRVLIIGTTYEDNQDRANLHDMWVKLHSHLNPECDIILVDNASPWHPTLAERHPGLKIHVFPDNPGHLETGGKDGWGRALSFGLQLAIDNNYDYAIHIEGDSLCSLNVMEIAQQMRREAIEVASTCVQEYSPEWVETGLMFFSVPYLQNSNFITRYDWASRTKEPLKTEAMLFQLFGPSLRIMPWITHRCEDEKVAWDKSVPYLDWITKCHRFAYYGHFFNYYMR